MAQTLRTRKNVVPGAYRGVSVGHGRMPLDEATLREHFIGREAYRRTRFIIVRDEAGGTALLHVEKESEEPLFSPILNLEVLAGPDECAYVIEPEADSAVPSELARVAVERAPAARAVVVEGRYQHVSFILNPAPLRLVVQEVVPPEPAKLFDQVRRLLAVAEDLPPMVPVPDTVSFADLANQAPSSRYLLPCTGSGVTVSGAPTAYLDQRPPHEEWTLLGCERSRGIHEWFYGERPPTVEMCPRQRAHDAATPMLTKCCLLEKSIEQEEGRAVVPWGASLRQVRDGLRAVADMWEPEWRPV